MSLVFRDLVDVENNIGKSVDSLFDNNCRTDRNKINENFLGRRLSMVGVHYT